MKDQGPSCLACVRIGRDGWHGMDGEAHCHDCHHTWTSRRAAHCPACCRHFTSYSSSDLHDGPKGCLDPERVEGLVLADDGFSWRLASHGFARGGPISARRSAVSPEEVA
jgi:hypothetical protein